MPTNETDVLRRVEAMEALSVSWILTWSIAYWAVGLAFEKTNQGASIGLAFRHSGCLDKHCTANSAVTGRPSVVIVGTALNLRTEYVCRSRV